MAIRLAMVDLGSWVLPLVGLALVAPYAGIGNRFVHTGKPTPQHYAQAVTEGGSLVFGVPTVWSRIVADGDAALLLLLPSASLGEGIRTGTLGEAVAQ